MEKNGIFPLSDAILQKYVKGFFVERTHFCSYLKKKDEASSFCSVCYQCCCTVDDHERVLIVLTEGSATAALIITPSPSSFPLPLLVITNRRVQEFLSTCWWFLARFNLCFPLSGEEFKFSYTMRRKCNEVVPVWLTLKYPRWRL